MFYSDLLRYFIVIRKFLKLHLILRFTWLEWTLPFKILEILIGILLWIFFSKAIVSNVYGFENPALFIIIGLSVNQVLTHGLLAYRSALLWMIRGRIGMYGQHLSMVDYMMIYGLPLSACILGFVLDGYIENFLILFLYLLIGSLLGLKPPPTINYGLIVLTLFLGIIATSGIGLVSASTTIILKSWRGREPIQWTLTLLSNIFAGVYFPTNLLPPYLQPLSKILPQTYVLKIIRKLYSSYNIAEIKGDLITLSIYSIISLVLGIVALKEALKGIRREPLID